MRIRLLLTTVFTLVASLLIVDNILGDGTKISNGKALSIAQKEAKKLGYQTESMDVEATLYKTHWNRILPKDSTDEYYLERQDKLKGRIYWAVYFSPSGSLGGDVCIFVDSTTGEILTDYRGE